MKPFLKWAGGKTRIVGRIKEVLPEGKRLIEPFVGSGAVFLNTEFNNYLLTDANPDLINLFRHLKEEGSEFIEYSRIYFSPEYNAPETFYTLRELFNTTTDTRVKAALFIYLNRHCFNGLCRYNSKGAFNVPFGKYKKPPFPEREMLAFHEKAKQAIFEVADFRETMSKASRGDVVYCDPPYVPLTATANFTDYAMGGFSMNDQQDLADMARKLQSRGIPVIISNHNTEWIQQAYIPARMFKFDVQRFISANSANRCKASEVLAVFD